MPDGREALLTELVDLAKIVLPALITLSAAYLAYRFANKRALDQRRRDLIERKITDFYSPMVGSMRKIRAMSELRLELSSAANASWREICERAPKPFRDSDKKFEPYKKIIEYENQQLSKEIVPLYDEMLAKFTENYWLAEETTKSHYGKLLRFVELWHRFLGGSLPGDVLERVDHGEDELKPLYADLDEQMKRLKRELT